MRLDLVDGIRGHLLIGMLIAHLSFAPGMAALGYFHHHQLIGMYDAEFFIPISGFIIGYLFAQRMNTTSLFYKFLNARLWTIYKYYLLSAVPFLIIAFFANPSLSIIGPLTNVAVMQDGGAYSDILPIYFYCFLLLYMLFWMVPHIGFVLPLIVSATIYLWSQSQYQTGMFGLSSRFVIFDIAAWQFLFMLFLFLGARSKDAAEVMRRIPIRTYYAAFALLVIVLVAGRIPHPYPTSFPGYEELNPNWPRMQLHPLFLAKILTVCLLFTLVLLRPEGFLKWPNHFAKWYFALPFVRNVGKYSIQMFTLHVFMMALFNMLSNEFTLPMQYVFAIGLLALFIAAPNLWVNFKKRRSAFVEAPA
ncbi:OpgC domain-containing protein [Allopontixanthobacter sediminis]|uniref:OpgC protein n=1 Tax=Allopontixanthobacter sediminis TaxID=1689985 RepID=A0A845B350_9SPHN|nr:OpgC domain-containing protein [Allopontixanthobacter sediminis]MXP44616.1 hypothetical protein [Allopontixanthobacter sediminis]